MKIMEPYVMLIDPPSYEDLLSRVETAGRVCYKSESKISDGSAEKFVANIIRHGHEAVLEHASLTARFVCDRGVSHELVRHRLAAYCQESTRYCNYSGEKFGKEITVVKPPFWAGDSQLYQAWKGLCETAETTYLALLACGAKPEEARSVLPNSLKTEVVMTADLREWRHFFRLRTTPAAHPQMRQAARQLLEQCRSRYPVFFSDLVIQGEQA